MSDSLILPTQTETHRFADLLASNAAAGLTLLLDGPVGAGKTTLARRIIQRLLAQDGNNEDVPSPTFTILQTYETASLEIWHADLYRLTSTHDLVELGLDTAFDTAFCLVEWSDRLGDTLPDGLRIALSYAEAEGARHATLSATSDKFSALAGHLIGSMQL